MKCLIIRLAVVLTGIFCLGLSLSARINSNNVIVLANSNSAESLQVAEYYMQARSIPQSNLVVLPMPLEEEIHWDVFVRDIYNPMLEECVRKGWISADRSDRVDVSGRKIFALYSSNIDFLVLSRHVPLKIANNPELIPNPVPPGVEREYLTTQASVDSELCLLPMPKPRVYSYVMNPLFQKLNPGSFTTGQILRVARLDGPSLSAVYELIRNALIAEQNGLMGRAYIDFGQKYAQGDEWLEKSRKTIKELGFSESIDEGDELFGWDDRFDAPAIYFGWWSWNPVGMLSDRNFRFPPGALAIHIHSYSGATLRDPNKGWTGPLVERGITGTVGNVYEPYLQLTHNPHLFIEALAAGKSFGEAAYYSQPAMSWQTIVVGDPLYRPFNVPLSDQLDVAAQEGFVPYAQYAIIRKMNRMRNEGNLKEAAEWGVQMYIREPGMALAYELTKCFFELKEFEKAYQVLEVMKGLTVFNLDDQGLAVEIARFMHENGMREDALSLYERLLADPAIHLEIAKLVLPDALGLAKTMDRKDLVGVWLRYMQENGINP